MKTGCPLNSFKKKEGPPEVLLYKKGVEFRDLGNREILRDKSGRIIGRFETDTGVTRTADGKIIGRGSNQLLRLLK